MDTQTIINAGRCRAGSQMSAKIIHNGKIAKGRDEIRMLEEPGE
jgi:hypothetical protein